MGASSAEVTSGIDVRTISTGGYSISPSSTIKFTLVTLPASSFPKMNVSLYPAGTLLGVGNVTSV
jgi:hypothetical protein